MSFDSNFNFQIKIQIRTSYRSIQKVHNSHEI
jgi:hypothetical protein